MTVPRKIILGILLALLACEEKKPAPIHEVFEPTLLAIAVENIETSISWYTQNLGFEIEGEIKEFPDYGLKLAFLSHGNFHLEIIENANSQAPAHFLPDQESYISGLFKIGFSTHDLQTIFDQLKQKEGIDFVTGIGDLPENSLPIPWPSKHFLLRDPDGNFIQFFNAGSTKEIRPWLTMTVVDKLKESISWHEKNLGYTHLETMGEEGNKRAILVRNNYVVELFEPKTVLNPAQIAQDTTILGYKKIAYGIPDMDHLRANMSPDTEIVVPVEKSDFDWANKSMILKDVEGNWIQFFELTDKRKATDKSMGDE